MKSFKLQGLADWVRIGPDEIMQFDAGESGRRIAVEFNVSKPVEVYAAPHKDMDGEVLLAASDGQFAVEVATREPVFMQVRVADPASVVFMRSRTADHRVSKVSLDKFTSIEMRRTRNPELHRMMMMVRLNAQAREDRMAAEVAALKQKLEALEAADAGSVVEPSDPAVGASDGSA